jgi:hypothetical protein
MDFYHKYIKYKKKYLEILRIQQGGFFTPDINEVIKFEEKSIPIKLKTKRNSIFYKFISNIHRYTLNKQPDISRLSTSSPQYISPYPNYNDLQAYMNSLAINLNNTNSIPELLKLLKTIEKGEADIVIIDSKNVIRNINMAFGIFEYMRTIEPEFNTIYGENINRHIGILRNEIKGRFDLEFEDFMMDYFIKLFSSNYPNRYFIVVTHSTDDIPRFEINPKNPKYIRIKTICIINSDNKFIPCRFTTKDMVDDLYVIYLFFFIKSIQNNIPVYIISNDYYRWYKLYNEYAINILFVIDVDGMKFDYFTNKEIVDNKLNFSSIVKYRTISNYKHDLKFI